MLVRIDTREIDELSVVMARSAAVLDRQVIKAHLRTALRPMLKAAKAKAPVSGKQYKNKRGDVVGAERISLRYRKNLNPNDYRRGGATKRDLRIKVVDDRENRADVMGLVGVDKRRGKVGWRTHFITRQITLHGRPYLNPKHGFLEDAYKEQSGVSTRIFEEETGKTLDRYWRRALKRSSATG